MKTKIIVIVGPTAVGKTALAIEVAKRFNGEVVSGDSQQVYRGLDIGTAKASPEEQATVPHHLIDVREITESYSAFDFVSEAKLAIEDIHQSWQASHYRWWDWTVYPELARRLSPGWGDSP